MDVIKSKSPTDRTVLLIGFVWAFLESFIWFVLPDFYVAPAILSRPKLAKRLITITIVGTTIGTLLMLLIASLYASQVREILVHIPFTTEAMFAVVSQRLQDGPLAILAQPFSGIPVKVWSWTAIAVGYSLPAYLALVTFGRIIRIVLVAGIGLLLARGLRGKTLRPKLKTALWILYPVILIVMLYLTAY